MTAVWSVISEAATAEQAAEQVTQVGALETGALATLLLLSAKTEGALMNDEAMAYFTENDYRGRKSELKDDFEHAINRLGRVSELVQLAGKVDRQKFVMSILGNKQTSNRADARWNRIYRWSH